MIGPDRGFRAVIVVDVRRALEQLAELQARLDELRAEYADEPGGEQ